MGMVVIVLYFIHYVYYVGEVGSLVHCELTFITEK
jgi:hypothetical protein